MVINSVEVIETAAVSHHGEGPVWDADAASLHWVDLTGGAVHGLSEGDVWTSHRFAIEITALAPHADGGLAAATADGFARIVGGRLRSVSPLLATRPDLRMNDGACDRAGRFLAGSMSYDATPAAGTLHRLELDGHVSTLVEHVTIPNGLDWSPDGSLLYFTDSARGLVTIYDYDHDTGLMSGARPFLDFTAATGEPDGLTVDSEGNLWIAIWDGWQIRCYSPAGLLLLELPVPVQRPTSVAFGGADLRDLYITTSRYELSSEALAVQPAAGLLLRYRSDTIGRLPYPCRVP